MVFKKYVIVVFIILIANSMEAQNWPNMLTPKNDIIPRYGTKINGIEFSIGIDDYRKSLFIVTNDVNFKIDNNPVIGRSLSSFKNKSNITSVRGWGYYLKIDDYWYVAFRYDELKDKLDDNSKVVFAFQYNLDN